ncbi:MAG: hypothetical protein KDA47_20865, partial [Planctomycetales bacterium]|nr:hypothetical protein [Planctomycetales bacterium]
GGTSNHVITVPFGSSLNVIDQPGVAPPLQLQIPASGGNYNLIGVDGLTGVRDGDLFIVQDGLNVLTFEFDRIDQTPADLDSPSVGVTGGNIPIFYQTSSTQTALASAIVAALQNANIGLNPSHLGNGIIDIGGSFSHQLDVPANTSLPGGFPGAVITKSGVPGGAIPIVFTPHPDFDVAQSIVEPINQGILPGVSASIRGGSTLFVDFLDSNGEPADFNNGSSAVTTGNTISTFFLPAIKDLPGNTLKANQATNDTQFVILLPGVQLDYGDAPDPLDGPGGPGRYPTLFENNGARHVVTPGGLRLGSSIDADNDGHPARGAVGDDRDYRFDVANSSVTLAGNSPYAIQIPTLTNGAIAINPSDTFTITPLGKATTTFEFNTSSAAVTLGHVGIIYSPSDTADVLADAMVAAINNANGLGLNASYQGGGIVFIGGSPTQTVDATNSPVSVSGLPPYLLEIPLGGGNAIIDGQSIVIGNGTITKTFEFNSTGGLLNSQHIEVVYDSMDGRDAIAASLIAAVQAEGIGVTLTALGNGMIHIEGPLSHELNLA